ncbi:hypothetical protein [Actinophytocola sediminis]
MLPTLLNQIDDLTDMVVTADALHTKRATARYLHDRAVHRSHDSLRDRCGVRPRGVRSLSTRSLRHRTVPTA